MSWTDKFLKQLVENRLADLHTMMPCKVEIFDEEEGTAKLIPLYKTKFADQDTAIDKPPLIEVPVLKRKIKVGGVATVEVPFYEAGDIVLVGFMERAFDMVANGEPADPAYNRKHALDDAVILGLL